MDPFSDTRGSRQPMQTPAIGTILANERNLSSLPDVRHRGILFFFLLLSASLFLFPSLSHASLVTNATLGTNTNSTLNQGLVGHWTFDSKDLKNNVADRSGLGNNGYMSGFGATSSAVTAGKLGQGLKFDGVNDYVQTVVINDASITSFTYSLWFKTSASQNNKVLISWANNSKWCRVNSTNNIQCNVADTALGAANGSTVINNGKWHSLIYVAKTDNTQQLYIDGILDGPGTTTIAPGLFDLVRIGASAYGSPSSYFNGNIDDVRIYSRALSASEIKQLYNAGAGSKVNASQQTDTTTSLKTGLVGHWTFDSKDLKTNVADRSGLGNTGYLTNFGATSSAVVVGKLGQGLKFDGVNDFVNLGNLKTAYNLQQFTISGWINVEDAAVGRAIFGNLDTNNHYGYQFYVSTNRVLFFTSYNASGVPLDNLSSVAVGPLTLNRWYHVAVTADGSAIKMYINGSFVAQDASQTEIPYVASTYPRIGDRSQHASFHSYFKGEIDNINFHSRALSASEIKQLYNTGAGSKVNASQQTDTTTSLKTGLVGYWTFDSKDLKTNVADTSNQNNTGFLTLSGSDATSTFVTIGKIGQALRFNGIAANDVLMTSTANTVYDNSTFTVTGWMKTNSATAKTVISKNGTTGGWSLGFDGVTSDRFHFIMKNAGGGSIVYRGGSAAANIVNDNKWHHFAFVVTTDTVTAENNTIDIYTDGVLAQNAQTTSAAYVSGGVQPLRFGRNYNSTSYYPGVLDDVRIYSRALSAQEIKQLYNMGR